MAATMKDIAKRTGLGLATISKYLNGGNVRPKNKALIDEAVKALGFRVNEAARSLKTNRSHTIGIVIPELSNIFVTSIISVTEDILRHHGYAVIICDCRTNTDREIEAVDFLIQKGAECIINMPVCQTGEHLLPAIERGIAVVLIDRMISSIRSQVDGVMVDNVSASFTATEYLLKHGHEKIGIIVGPQDIFTSQQRLLGYRQAILGEGVLADESLIAYSDYNLQGGYESMSRLLELNRDMTAVFVTNYEMTLGAMMYLNEKGIRIPQELSFIGFDNMQLSKILQPRLTIIDQPLAQIGEKVAQRVIARLQGDASETGPVSIVLYTTLHEGASVMTLD